MRLHLGAGGGAGGGADDTKLRGSPSLSHSITDTSELTDNSFHLYMYNIRKFHMYKYHYC